MKIKRLIPIFAVALCAVLLLTSCAVKFDKDVVNTSKVNDAKTAEALPDYGTLVDSEGNLVLFNYSEGGVNNYSVYNLTTNSVVLTMSLSSTGGETLEVGGDYGFAMIRKKTVTADNKTTYAYYTASGAPIIDGTKEEADFRNDCLIIGTTVYRISETTGEIIATYERSDLASEIPSCDYWNEEYYYDESGETLTVYDSQYKFISEYKVPSYASNSEFHFFSDGYVIAQYFVQMDALEDDYDYFQSGTKFDVVTVRINPKNGDTKELKTDYIIESNYIVSAEEMEENVYGDKVEDVTGVLEIHDRRVDGTKIMIMSLNSNLSGDRINVYKNVNVEFYAVGNGYVIADEDGGADRVWLLDAKGKEIGEIAGMKAHTEKYIMTENAIYGYDLNKIADYEVGDNSYNFINTVGNYPIFGFLNANSEIEYYIYNEAGYTILGVGYDSVIVEFGMYAIKGTDGAYIYYAPNGTQLFTAVSVEETPVAATEDYYLIRATLAGAVAPTYYRVSR